MTDCDVVVVGAGPSGLALACALRLHGISVRIVDRASGPTTTSRANILQARGVEVLDRLGALGELPRQAKSAMTVTQYLDGQPSVTIRFGDPGLGTARPALYISQAEIEAELRRRLQELGGRVEWNAELVGLVQGQQQVAASLRSDQVITCEWLVGCDGAHSIVRKLTGIGFPGVPITEKFLLADVHADWPMDRAGGHGWPHEDGPLFAMPMLDVGGGADNLWRLMAYDPASSDALAESEIVERLGQLVAERTGGMTIRIHDTIWASSFRAHRRLAQHYRMGRVFLSGDAAHIHSPLGGQGMATGMGDAENLAWKLALVVSGEATETLLDTYENERRPVATEVLRGTTTATRLQVGKGPLMRFLRNNVLARIAKLPSVQRRASLIASQLWVTYRNGPLGSGRGPWSGPGRRAGDRVPDMVCRRTSGSATRLHAELGGRWALLLPADSTGDFAVETRSKLGDGAVTLTTDGNEVLLVRPDAHLAWCGRDPSGLGRWLGRVLRNGTARGSNAHPLHS